MGRSGGVGEGGREMERRAAAGKAREGVDGGLGGAGSRHERISDRLLEKKRKYWMSNNYNGARLVWTMLWMVEMMAKRTGCIHERTCLTRTIMRPKIKNSRTKFEKK